MKKRIVLIEKDRDACLLFTHVLSNAGYDVSQHYHPNFVFNSQYETPDLFIFDNSLPSIDGVALTKYLRIKNETKHVPILVISDDVAASGKARKAGASGFITKPFDAAHFLQIIQTVVVEGKYFEGSGSIEEEQIEEVLKSLRR